MKKRPTQSDVARQAGVSRATVSYVINRQTKGRVPISAETRRKVLAAAAKLGYEPDARAQSLRSGRTNTIGLLIPDLHNPHFWQIITGVSKAVRAAGYDFLLATSNLDPQQEVDSIKALARRRIDGLILLPAFTKVLPTVLSEDAASRRPIVMIGFREGYDSIGSKYSQMAAKLMSHLLELGHERIGFIHGVANPTMGRGRLQSYKDSLVAAGIDYDEQLVAYCGATTADGYEAAINLLTQQARPSAIIVINDLLATGVIRAAADLKLSIPRDFSLVGFDDIPAAQYLVPRLTTVQVDAEAIGEGAVKLLLARLQDRERPIQTVHISAKLMIRESTTVILGSAEVDQ
ncbi:MAG: LacI family DNA-binding transcriptional regulator [Methylococcales bacterium]|nr:LacI family DNA-binding transcriptional regulator [Methylococcales bacterium]